MIRKIAVPAVLLAAALGGASVAYAATGAGMSTAPVSPQPSATTMNPAPGTADAGATTTRATQQATKTPAQQATKTPAMPKVHYIAFSDRVNAKDVAAFDSSKVSLDRAISSAEHEVGGKAVEAVFKAAPQHPHYVVWVMKNDRILSTWVDPESGKVTTHGHGTTLRRLYAGERMEFMKTDHARIGLGDAVAFARTSSGNNPIAASMERREGTNAYDITIVSKGKLQAVWVSPGTPMNVASK